MRNGTKMQATDVKKFADYVYSFYGKSGLYPMKPELSHKDILCATVLLHTKPDLEIEYDSVDRERVRDILLDEMSYKMA